ATCKTKTWSGVARQGPGKEYPVVEKGETRCLKETQEDQRVMTPMATKTARVHSGQAPSHSDSLVSRLISIRVIARIARRCACSGPTANRWRGVTIRKTAATTSMMSRWSEVT